MEPAREMPINRATKAQIAITQVMSHPVWPYPLLRIPPHPLRPLKRNPTCKSRKVCRRCLAQTNWSAATSAVPPQDPSTGPTVASTTVEVDEIGGEDPTSSPQTVRTVQVQIVGEGDGRVDLRLVQHGDGLSVSVRSSDSALTKGLQENLPELSARLAADKYQTHAFLPAVGNTNGSSSTSSEDHAGQSQINQTTEAFRKATATVVSLTVNQAAIKMAKVNKMRRPLGGVK